MISAWRRFWRLSAGERRDLLLGVLFVPAAVVRVKLFGVPRLSRFGKMREKVYDDVGARNLRLEEARTTARMAAAAARHGLVHGNCLSRSMALSWMLRRRGVPAELRIGASKEVREFEAHAWVEVEGEIINDADDVRERYVPFEGPLAGETVARK